MTWPRITIKPTGCRAITRNGNDKSDPSPVTIHARQLSQPPSLKWRAADVPIIHPPRPDLPLTPHPFPFISQPIFQYPYSTILPSAHMSLASTSTAVATTAHGTDGTTQDTVIGKTRAQRPKYACAGELALSSDYVRSLRDLTTVCAYLFAGSYTGLIHRRTTGDTVRPLTLQRPAYFAQRFGWKRCT